MQNQKALNKHFKAGFSVLDEINSSHCTDMQSQMAYNGPTIY